MQASGSPTLIPLPFAASGAKNTIPEASQLPGNPGGASLTDGFPPATRTPLAAGGIPPSGLDMNGILNLITATLNWQHAGGQFKWNSAFANDANVNGYPAGAALERADGAGFWLNLADNNKTNPDATDGSAANWVPLEAYGIAAVTGLTNANVTLTPLQFGLPIITLSGALTANVQIIFPAIKSQWLVMNNTTGNFTLTCKTAAGSGVALAQGGGAQLYGDGTNIVLPNAQQVGPATAGAHAAQFKQVVGIAGSAANLKCILTAVGTALPYSADQLLVASALNGLTYMIPSFNANISALDTGALAANSYYAVYGYLKSDGTTGGLLQLEPSGGAPAVYGGANPPANMIASALIGVWPTNASAQFIVGFQQGRRFEFASTGVFSGSGAISLQSFSLSNCVPKSAKFCSGLLSITASSGGISSMNVFVQTATGSTSKQISVNTSSGGGNSNNFNDLMIVTPQTLYVNTVQSATISNVNVSLVDYSF